MNTIQDGKIGNGHKSLVTYIVEDIEAKIISGIYKPGERLIEEKLCRELDVSRSPVREAFRLLETNGFLTNVARKGVSVTKTTLKEAIDIYIIRANLESLAVYLAVKRSTPEFVLKLKTLHKQMEDLVKINDIEKYIEKNKEFHNTIIQASDNSKLMELLEYFSKISLRYRHVVLTSPGRLSNSLKKHKILIKSIEDGDAEVAERHRKEDILGNIDLVKELFGET